MSYLKKNVFALLIFFVSSLFGASRDFVLEKIEKPFVILITSYNNQEYARDNIISAITQNYEKYRVIFINDCSCDSTLEIVEETIKEYGATNRVQVINNKERKLGLRNYYEAIVKHTQDEEIIINLDGDDFLINKNVLRLLNKVYTSSQKEIWMTYGQFVTMQGRKIGFNWKIPEKIVEKNDFRTLSSVPSHLRTFYSWLFKRINMQDLLYNGRFFEMAWDCAFMLPMLEMCNGRFMFINKPLYIYNDSNPINDHRVNKPLQDYYARYVRGLLKYKPLQHDVFTQCEEEDCILCHETIKDKKYESFY